MAIRMTGLVSGMDTEGIIKELMSAKSLKKTKIEQRKTKLEWTKEKWADLNTKLYKLYSEQASKLRLESTYNAKKASSSNEQKLGVTASSAAANGSYTLKVSQIATSQYVTGAVLDPVASKPVTASTKLTDIDATLLNRQIEVNTGTDVSHFQIKADSTVADMVSAFSQAGLNASFDEKQQRFFFSSKKSGAANTFTVTTTQLSNEEVAARNAIEDYIGYAKLNTANRKIVQDNYAALAELTPGSTEYTKQLNALSDVAFTQKTATNQDAARNVMRARVYQEKYDEVYKETKEKYYDKDAAGNFTTIKENISKSL